jgi:hypothetical protein
MTCSGCGTDYSFSEQLIGRTARCRKCDHPLTVGSPPASPDPDQDADTFSPEPDDLAGRDSGRPGRSKKKAGRRRGSDPAAAFGWKLAAGVGVLLVLLLGGGVALVVALVGGGDDGPNLVGKWKGATEVRQAVREATKDKMHPVAGKFAEALAQHAADELLAVTLDFKKSGTVFFSGNTSTIGVSSESDSPWDILYSEGDVVAVRMGPRGEEFDARLAFRDKDTFILTRPDQKDQPPVVFKRVKD